MPTLDEAIDGTPPLDAAITGVADDKRRQSLYGAVRQNPDEYGRAVQLARATGVPAPVVARNLPDVEQRAKFDALDAAVDRGSALAVKLESQDFAALSHDDIASLKDIERTLNRRSAGKIDGPAFVRKPVAMAFSGPDATASSVVSGLLRSVPQGGEATRQGLRLQFADLIGAGAMREDALQKYQQNQFESALSTPEFDSATARGVYSGGVSLLRNLPGMAASIATGNPAPALATIGAQTEADAYGKYRARGATPGMALLGATGEGATEVGTEMLPMGFLVKNMGKVGTGQFLSGLLAREIPSEQIATLVQDAVDTAVANPDKTWGQYLKERPGAAYETLVATLTQAGAMEGAHVAMSRLSGTQQQANQALQDAAAIDHLTKLSTASKVRPRDMQSFEDFVQSASEGGPVENIHIDTRALQQSGIPPETLATLSPTAAAQMQEAIATGGDLVIPIGEYAGRIAGTELDSVLAPHLRTSEDALSLDEAQKYFQTQGEQFRAEAARIMEEKSSDDAFQASAKAVEGNLFAQLKQAGRFTDDVNTAYATLMRDFYVTTASRLGLTPEEMFSRYPLQVRAESVAAEQRMGQGDTTPVSADRVALALDETRWLDRGLKIGKATKLYRGVSDRTGKNTANFGRGLYVTTDKSEAAQYGDVKGMPLTDLPQNPLRFADEGKFREWESFVAREVFGHQRMADFEAARGIPDEWVRLLDPAVDGIQIGTGKGAFFVRFPDVSKAATSSYTGGNTLSQGGQNGTGTDRPGVQAEQEPRTVGGGTPRVDWTEQTRIRTKSGKPATVYRGASRPLGTADFNAGSLGHATGNPSSGLGVWFSLDREDAAGYGSVTEGFQLDIRKPKVYRDSDIPGFDTPQEAQAFARELQSQGYDGIAIDYRGLGGPLHLVAFTPETVIQPAAPKPLDMSQFFQGEHASTTPQTETEAFKKWFGDSKVVDENGKPLVVYHGGNEKIAAIEEGKGKFGGIFVRLGKSSGYGRVENEFYLRGYATLSELRDAIDSQEDGGESLIKKFLGDSVANTDDVIDALTDGGHYPIDEGVWESIGAIDEADAQVEIQKLRGKVARELGFGAIETPDEFDGETVMVLDPAQIKSATGNRGTFDPNDPNVLAQPTEERGGNRAEISFSKDITQTPTVVTLFKNADLSSFLHEMGHFQLEVLANIASRPDAPQGIVDDMNAALKWFGIKGTEDVKGGEQSGSLGQGAVGQTETPEFKAWFGDSKVVDENGKPLPMYHGTSHAGFEFFDTYASNYGLMGMGGYFTADPAVASSYTSKGKGDSQGVYKVYLSIQNPIDMEAKADPAEWAKQFDGIEQYHEGGDTNESWYRAAEEMISDEGVPKWEGAEAMQDGLRAMGHDGITHIGGGRVAADGIRHRVYVAFDPEQIKSAIGNSGAFNPNDTSILAQGGGEGAKPSTLPKGRTALDVWNAMSLEEKRPYHEQFARGFEAYLFEGKAPNQELQSLFQRFRAWMVSVYKSMANLRVEINDEIRGVFDRLLATDEMIKAAEDARSMTPLFATSEEMGDTPQAWADYQRIGIEASRDAQDELQQRSMKDMRWLTNARSRVLKELQRDAKDKRKTVEEEVRAEVDAMPVYAAQKFLKRGELVGPDGEQIKAEKGHRLDTGALAEMYPETMLNRPNLDGLRGMTRKDGLHPDLVAEMFGFTSGDQLVRDILTAENKADLITGLTDQRMLERYGDLNHPDTLARAADEAIHNDARARFVATELKALSKAQGPVRVMQKAAKEFAEAMLSRKQIKDIKPNQYAAAETRAAKNAEKALKSGDSATAVAEKRNQLVQNYATRAAYDALTEIEKGVRYLRKFDTEGTRKNIDSEYTDQIDTLLERFDLRTSVSNKDSAKRESLIKWVEGQREQGFEPDIPPELLSEAMRKPYRTMTLEELRGLVDTVKQIEHLGRLKQKLLTAKDEREFQAVVTEISTSIEQNAQGRTAETRTPTDALGKLAASLKRFWASHIKAATWSRVLDGGADGGAMWEYFMRSANERGDMETSMRADATLALSSILSPVVKTWPTIQGKGRYFESVKRAFTREGAMAVALNTGNEGNLQRLLGGEGWTFQQIRPVLESLTAQEWQAVQAVWDHFETYRPEIGAKERRIYGKEPNWIEPTPFTIRTADGQEMNLKGGYYPIKYDAAASQRAEEHAAAEQAKRDMQGAYTAATTRRSFTKARSEEVSGRPLLYSLVGVYSGVNDVIHDLSWHEWLIDANRLLRSKAIDQAIRSHYGPQVKDQYKQWVKDVAQGETRADNPAEVGVSWLRQGVSAAGLGFNVMSALMQVTGYTQSIVRVGPTWAARGLAQYAANPVGKAREVLGKSSFMEGRNRTQFRELNELRNQVEGQTAAGRALSLGTYFLMMRMQKMVDVPTWLGAYEKAITEGNNEERSIALADQAVIDSQGSGMVKDLSTIERGGPALKLFTVFYSYMNTALNMGVQVGMTEQNKAKFAAKMLMIYSVPVVLGYAFKHALTPGGGDDDDPEKLAKALAAEHISYLTGLFVGVREFSEMGKIVTGAEGVRDYAGPAGARVVGDAYKAGKQAMQGEFDDAFRKASINLLGDLSGMPSAQINRTITGVNALSEGDTSNPAAVVLGYQKK